MSPLPGAKPLAGGVPLFALPTQRSPRAAGAAALAMQAMRVRLLCYRGHRPAPNQAAAYAVVLGRLPGHDTDARLLGPATPEAAGAAPLRDSLDDAAQASPRDGAPRPGAPQGQGRGR